MQKSDIQKAHVIWLYFVYFKNPSGLGTQTSFHFWQKKQKNKIIPGSWRVITQEREYVWVKAGKIVVSLQEEKRKKWGLGFSSMLKL